MASGMTTQEVIRIYSTQGIPLSQRKNLPSSQSNTHLNMKQLLAKIAVGEATSIDFHKVTKEYNKICRLLKEYEPVLNRYGMGIVMDSGVVYLGENIQIIPNAVNMGYKVIQAKAGD
jgi:hypothetical protein